MLPPNWVLNMRDLINRATDGRDSLYSGIKELEKYGYCAKIMRRNPDGTIAGYAYEICDKAVFQPFTENPVTDAPQTDFPGTDKPDTEKPGTENPTLINTNDSKDLNIPNTNDSDTPQKAFAANLFPEEQKVEEPKDKKTLFRNSEVYKMVKFENGVGVDYSEFERKFATPEFERVDLVYYFHSVSDWSDQKNMKRTKNGWLATVRNFIRDDVERKKLHLKPEYKKPTEHLNVAGAIEYLKDDY